MKELLEKIAEYGFECEAGLLTNCAEWQELLKRSERGDLAADALLAAPRYVPYTAADEEGNLHALFTSPKVLSDDIANLQSWAAEVVRENAEADGAMDSLLNLNPGIAPSE